MATAATSLPVAAQSLDRDRLRGEIETVRLAARLPAMAAAIVTSAGMSVSATAGIRKRGTAIAATDDDLWHLGSNGKAITAAMIARLVERGVMAWDQSLGGSFPERAARMPPGLRAVTLTDLLTHHAGLPRDVDWSRHGARDDQAAGRVAVLDDAVATAVTAAPASPFFYSNLGYVLAGAMAERAAGRSFEELVRDEIAVPLGMTSLGFGAVGTVGRIDQPWPHTASGTPAPDNGATTDNPPVMAPAGTMHMTLADWGRFITDQLRGAYGIGTLLRRGTYARLQTAVGTDPYAMGWVVVQRPWANGAALTHTGSNTFNVAVVWMASGKDMAILIVTNQGGSEAAVDALAARLVRLVK